jgi:tape measure domain-containing protein
VTGGIVGLGVAVHQLNRSIDEAANMESLEVSMEVLTGSATTAKDTIADLVNFAAKTPFTLNDLAPATKQLLAFGVPAQDTIGYLRRLGDVASALDIPLGELVEVYGRNLVQGRLFARDIYQFQNRGIPIIAELAKHFGVTEDKILGMVSAGKVGAGDMQKAFVTMTDQGGVFFGMMDRQSQIWRGKMSTLRDMWTALQRSFGRPLIAAMLPGLDAGIRKLTALVPQAENAGRSVAALLSAFRGGAADGRLAELLGVGLQYGFARALNVLYAGLSAAAIGFSEMLGLGVANMDAIEDVLTGAAAQFGAALLKAIQTPLAHLQGFMEQLVATPWLALAAGGSAGAAASFNAQAGARSARILREGGPTLGFGGEGMNADQIARAAREKVATGIAQLVKPLSDGILEVFGKIRAEGLSDIAGAAEIKKQFSGLVQELKESTAATKESTAAVKDSGAASGEAGAAPGGVQMATIKGDSLARIGGFIGGAGGPALDYARRTAIASEKVAEKITKALLPQRDPALTSIAKYA